MAVPGCTFILDGLDECSLSVDEQPFNQNNAVVDFLSAIKKAFAGTSTRLLIVSRDEPEIRRGLSQELKCPDLYVYQCRIQTEDVQPDIEAFSLSVVRKKLPSRTVLEQEELAQGLAKQCNGQFLWVKMQEDHLRSGKSQKKLENVIKSTPPGLEHTYDRNWKRISSLPDYDRDRTVSLLRWTAFSLRPLSVYEIAGALAVNIEFDEVQLDEVPDLIDEEYLNTEILELCGSLVEIRASQPDCEPGLRTVHLRETVPAVQYNWARRNASGRCQPEIISRTERKHILGQVVSLLRRLRGCMAEESRYRGKQDLVLFSRLCCRLLAPACNCRGYT